MLWGNIHEIIKTLEEGLTTDDVEYKQLCLSVLLGHLTYLIQKMNLLPDEDKHNKKFKIILQELCQEHL
jgi:hypothetical protein